MLRPLDGSERNLLGYWPLDALTPDGGRAVADNRSAIADGDLVADGTSAELEGSNPRPSFRRGVFPGPGHLSEASWRLHHLIRQVASSSSRISTASRRSSGAARSRRFTCLVASTWIPQRTCRRRPPPTARPSLCSRRLGIRHATRRDRDTSTVLELGPQPNPGGYPLWRGELRQLARHFSSFRPSAARSAVQNGDFLRSHDVRAHGKLLRPGPRRLADALTRHDVP